MSTRVKLVVVGLVVVLAVAGAGAWWFLKDDAPPAVTLDRAVDAAESAPSAGGDTAKTGTGIDGTWVVDTQTGSFDFDRADGTFAGFRIGENLANIGSTTAVGRTGDVSGSLGIVGSRLTEAKITVDLTTIQTDRAQRRSKIQQALETSRFPEATFSLTGPVSLPADAAAGASIKVTAKGDLTIHGVTQAVEIPLEAKLVGDRIVVVGSTRVTFDDYGVSVPSSPIVVSADDHGTLELQLLFTKG
jgi:polyisoprenoid-binding protein YceI